MLSPTERKSLAILRGNDVPEEAVRLILNSEVYARLVRVELMARIEAFAKEIQNTAPRVLRRQSETVLLKGSHGNKSGRVYEKSVGGGKK